MVYIYKALRTGPRGVGSASKSHQAKDAAAVAAKGQREERKRGATEPHTGTASKSRRGESTTSRGGSAKTTDF